MNPKYDLVWNLLREFFNHEHYSVAVRNLRCAIATNNSYQRTWKQFVDIVSNRELSETQPLTLVQDGANQVLDENSDSEAYVWLEKVIFNVNREDNIVDSY